MPQEIPSKFATLAVGWGERKKHLTIQDHESLELWETEEAAMSAVTEALESGDKMVLLLRADKLFTREITVVEL